jgi:hypothetical protein
MGLFRNIMEGFREFSRGGDVREFTSTFSHIPGFADPANMFEQAGRERDIRQDISETPPYQIPEEVYELRDIYGEAADEMLGLRDIVGEATDVARGQTRLAEAPGAGILREDIRRSTASTISGLKEAGGASASVLGAITQAGRTEMDAVRALALQNQIYRASALSNYQQALQQEAGVTAGLVSGAAGLQGQGLMPLIQQQAIEFGYDRETYENLLNFDIIQLSNWQAQTERERSERFQTLNNLLQLGLSAGTGGLSNIGGGGGDIK